MTALRTPCYFIKSKRKNQDWLKQCLGFLCISVRWGKDFLLSLEGMLVSAAAVSSSSLRKFGLICLLFIFLKLYHCTVW